MKKVVMILTLMLTSSLAFAQDTLVASPIAEPEVQEPKFTAAVDVVYPYLWRGIKYYGDKVAFQPYMAYAFTDKLSVGVWATTNFSNAADAYNEFDWSISYQISPVVKVMLSDYYWPATKNNPDWERSSYFDYSEGSAQSLDLSVLLDFSEKGVPLDFQWNTFIGGGDYKYDENGNPTTRAYSSYAEIGYTYSIDKASVDIRPFVGAAVINGGYYGVDASGKAGFTFSNVGVNIAKVFKITKNYSIPVFVRYTNNDYGVQEFDENDNLIKTERNFFSAGMTFTIK
ncbi:TorF family putative porin [Flavobacterium urumqiense]|uniref:Outer membrane protein beta-barrel domain-containing protein n=1 Tax=Flavobacterium urumqiense TaxID=935224 RepID=A0A1H5XKM7_9FLAO|nr:TorF family putative porin [Flavobacterium urumqiense]SEG11786.1 protein of unknown function (Gcw_chp) [Flavobacterium urumqiense]